MSSRVLLTAVVAASAMVGLAACGPDKSADNASAAKTSAAAPAASTPAADGTTDAAATASPKAGSSDLPMDDAPACDAAQLPAHHKVVVPVKAASGGALSAKDTKTRCGVNDTEYDATGTAKSYQFASTVKAQLSTPDLKTVSLAALGTHIGDCLNHAQKADLVCSSVGAYEITQDSAGKITEIKELYHS